MPWTDAGRRKAAARRRGRHLSAATRAKMSKAHRHKHHKHKGHKQSAATRRKLSALRRAWLKAHRKAASHKTGNFRGPRRHRSNKFQHDLVGFKRRYGHGITNAQVLHIRNLRARRDNATILSIKLRHNIFGRRQRTNRRVILSRVPRRRRQ